MIKTTLTGGRGWLDKPAAASLHRIDARLGRRLDINSAGRTAAEQSALIKRWNNGDRTIGQPAALGASPHQTGTAIDTDDWRTSAVRAVLQDHGWRATVPAEPWHWVYNLTLDKYRNTPTTTDDQEDDDMIIYVKAKSDTAIYEVRPGGRKRHLNAAEWAAITSAYAAAGVKLPYSRDKLTKAQVNTIG